MKPAIEWTDDCCGKKDYDGQVLSIGTRYWPRGGGFFVLHNNPGEPLKWEGDETRPDIKPHANSSLCLHFEDSEGLDDYIELVERDFEGDTQEEVQRQVETWTQSVMDRVVEIVRAEWPIDGKVGESYGGEP